MSASVADLGAAVRGTTRARERALTLGLASSSALLYAVAHTALDPCMPVPLIAFVPILIAMRLRPFDPAAIALYAGLFAAVMLFGTQHYGLALYAVAVLAVGGFHVLPVLLYAALARSVRGELRLALAFATGYTWIDYAASLQTAVPIGRVAGTLGSDVAWLQLAPYGGPFLVGFLLCLVNALAAAAVLALLRARPRAAWRPALSALVLAGAMAGAGHALLGRPPTASRHATVAVIQGSLTREEYAQATPGSGDFTRSALGRYVRATEQHVGREDFVIWPEVLWVSYGDALAAIESIFRSASGRIVGGFPIRSVDSSGQARLINAFSFFHDSARPRAYYAKNHLVPFTESRFVPGRRPILLQTDLARFATPICFEAVFTHHVQTLLALDPDAILVPSNDSGFGVSLVSNYMLKQAIVHAVVGEKYLVRAAQSGISAIVDDRGRMLQRSAPFEVVTLTATIGLNRGTTFYIAHGDVHGCIGSGVLLLALALTGRTRRGEPFPGRDDS